MVTTVTLHVYPTKCSLPRDGIYRDILVTLPLDTGTPSKTEDEEEEEGRGVPIRSSIAARKIFNSEGV